MENAAKALIIAGGVLIGIIVMSIFVYAYNQFSQSTKNSYKIMEDRKINEFNQKFLNYDKRTDLTIHDIASIVNLAISTNKSEIYNTKIKVYVNDEDWTENYKDKDIISENIDKVINNTKYRCEVSPPNSDTLLIEEIYIYNI